MIDPVELKEKYMNMGKGDLSLQEKNYLYMAMLHRNAAVDDHIGTTLASFLVEGKSLSQCADEMAMDLKAFALLYDMYMRDTVQQIANVAQERELEKQEETPGFYICHRFNPITMIGGKSVNLFIQAINRNKFEELISENDYVSRIKHRDIIELYNSMFGLQLEQYWDHIEYKPGDTILVLDERIGQDFNGPLNETPLSYFYVEIDPIDPEEMI